jgi:hypothetical protein
MMPWVGDSARRAPASESERAPNGGACSRAFRDVTVGFDIYSRVRRGTTVDNTAFASLPVGGRTAFYGVDTLTGRADPVGRLDSRVDILDIAVPLDQG